MPVPDPFALLGIERTTDQSVIRRAWRHAAREAHPDAGGSDAAMRAVNEALTAALVEATTRSESHSSRQGIAVSHSRVVVDRSSFTVDVLPVDAYVALELVASSFGSIIVDEPPYMVEFTLHDSGLEGGIGAWCRCDLVPEAGASMVHVTVGAVDRETPPTVETVRDLLVAALNQIDWDQVD